MANTDFIWGAVIGCAALWYFTSRDKTSSVEVIPARTIQVNTTPNYITQGSYQVLPSTTYVPSYSFTPPCRSWTRWWPSWAPRPWFHHPHHRDFFGPYYSPCRPYFRDRWRGF